jgi:CubicO group peptidase (beta-lactamase class C family)
MDNCRFARASALGALLLTCAGCARQPGRQMSEIPDAKAIDSLFVSYAKPGAPGASIVVIENGELRLAKGYGLADVEANLRTDERTNFRLASLTKQFTATAILLLARDGRLALDERVRDILPELPAHTADVRVRHLLTHTSGLWAYEDFVPDSQTTQVHDADVPALIAHASGLYFPPGSRYRYSNTGYALLALIVERKSGVPFARYLRERVFEPLKMDSTVAYEAGRSIVPRRAIGYSATEAGFKRTDQSSTSAVLGDGGIYSSVHDLALWDRALDDHTLLGSQLQEAAWSATRLDDGTAIRYGYGWFVDGSGDDLRLSHHGETRGFTNVIVKYPRHRLTVIILSNQNGGAPWTIADRVARLYGAPPGKALSFD